MRALIGALVVLQATPAIWLESSVRQAMQAPLPEGQRSLTMRTRVGPVEGIWLHEGARDHLAIKEPFGPPFLVLRSDGARLGLTLRGRPEVVSEGDAAVRLTTQGALGLSDLLPLVAGRVPGGARLTPMAHGWLVTHGDLVAVLDREGTVQGATWGPLTLAGNTLQYGDMLIELELGPVTRRQIPEGAFTVGDGEHMPIEALGQLLLASRTSAISN